MKIFHSSEKQMPCQSFRAAISLWFMDYFCLEVPKIWRNGLAVRQRSDHGANFSSLSASVEVN
jgi:hypothetical protein